MPDHAIRQALLEKALFEHLGLLRSAFQGAGANQPSRQERKYDKRHDRSQHAGGEQPGGRRVSANPAPEVFGGSPRARFDWAALQKTVQVVRQLAGALIPLARFFSQALVTDCLEIAWNIRLQAGHGDGLDVQNLQNGVQRSRSLERGTAGEQLIEYCAKCVDVGGWSDGRAQGRGLFGRHVAGRA